MNSMLSPRDRVLNFISYSCQIGECDRCKPRVQSPTVADNIAPNCVHGCHDGTLAMPATRAAEERAFMEDRRRVLGF